VIILFIASYPQMTQKFRLAADLAILYVNCCRPVNPSNKLNGIRAVRALENGFVDGLHGVAL